MKKPINSGKPWNKKEIKQIEKKASSGETTKNIAKDLRRTQSAVRSKASEEGISLKPIDPKGSDKTKEKK